ncbi:MAG: glycosyltransferase [Betaproteobacteria bacterium]
MTRIDIIIPVYRGAAETRACIDSVLASSNANPVEIVVVNDASPESEIAEFLGGLADSGKITLLQNEANRGFVASVNRGMALHSDRDVILLNSDTEVADGWLDRLAACAFARTDAASISPFSNNATLCSYPRIGHANLMPLDMSLGSLDRMFAVVNTGNSVELPTTVGFCMFLRRRVLNEIGLFDEAAFGRGYGEENDWCLRASAKGHVHLLCADTFVLHRGEVSFAQSASSTKERAQAIVEERYPAYREQIARFFEDDPLRPLRRAVDIARLAGSPLPNLLYVTHNWGGGTEQHILDLIELVDGRANVLVMKPRSTHSLSIGWVTGRANREEFVACFEVPDDHEPMLRFLRGIGIARVHLHHVHGHAPAILNLAGHLGVPLDVTLHDYFPFTPRYHLEHGAALPEGNVEHRWGWSLSEWQSRMRALLASASRVISPSKDLADRIVATYPEIRIDVWPHPERGASAGVFPAKVLLLGGLTKDKGQEVVRACAQDAKFRELPLFFRVLGHTENPLPTYPSLPLTVSGSYRGSDLDFLMSLEHADVVMFPAQIPESYSFTLSAAIRSGLPIVASRLGAFPERLADYPKATMLEWNASPREWNEALCGIVVAPPAMPLANAAINAAYRDRYLSAITARKTGQGAPVLAPRHYFPSRELPRERELSLAALYTGGVLCGHEPARLELENRIGKFDEALKVARESADAAHEAAKQAGQYCDDSAARFAAAYAALEESARAEYRSIVESTTWRMTAPVRKTALWLKSAARGSVHAYRRALTIPRHAGNAAKIARQHGILALGRRIRDKFARFDMPIDMPVRHFGIEAEFAPLVIPSSETPRWSIIVPVYGQHKLTYTCLKSIADTCAGMAVEVIVADDCAPDPAREALAMVTGAHFFRNENNLGFLHNCNEAAKNARGEFLILLNNDTIVTGNWLDAMTAVFADDPKAGLVGVKLLFSDGKLQEAGGIVWRDGSASNYGRGQDPRRPEFNYRREVDYCSGACIMMRSTLWQQLGGFDERYAPAYYEDTDIAFRVREAGYRVIYQPHAEVVHFEGQTSGTDLTQGVKRHQVTNQRVFEERWRSTLASHRSHGISPHLERDRGATRRVLVIDICLVMPDRDSGSLRMYEMLKVMRELGCRISFVADNGQHPEQYARLTQSLGVEVLHAPFVTPLSAAITRYGDDFDVVVLSRALVAVKYVDLVKKRMPEAKLIFDTVDLHFLRQKREADIAGDAKLIRAADEMKAMELGIIAKADVSLVVSPYERSLLEIDAPRAHVQVLSNIHEPAPGPKPFAVRHGLVFIGGFRHAPNVDAMLWYATEVLPLLRARRIGIRTTVIGSDVPRNILQLAADDFLIAGYVPDVEPIFNEARIAIAPLRYGAGVKGKVNLAMQFGVPVVATSCSVEGMNLTAGEDVLVADDAAAFADAIEILYDDERLWSQLREGGLKNIRHWFSRDHARGVLKNLLDL